MPMSGDEIEHADMITFNTIHVKLFRTGHLNLQHT